jgi:HSP20 family protein
MNSLMPGKNKQMVTKNNGGLFSSNNFPAINQLRQELDQVFQRFFGDVSLFGDQKASWGIDLEDKDDSVIARFEAPGFDMKDFELKLNGNELVLKAERKSETKEKDRSEERHSSLYRSVLLPQGVLTEKAEAKFHNGLLTVTIPKAETAKGKKIAIQAS